MWQTGEMTRLGFLPGGDYSHVPGGDVVNERGQVVGTSNTADPSARAFLWEDGVMVDLGTLGGDGSWARAINERGDVVGRSQVASGEWHAFFWSDGEMTDLGTLGGATSEAIAVNDRGRVIGVADSPTAERQGVVWDVR